MSDSRIYRIFDQRLCCDFPLTGLPSLGGEDADLKARLSRTLLDDAGFAPIHAWRNADGSVVSSCERRGDRYVLRFPGLADFLLVPGTGEITAFPAPGASPGTLAHLLMDQVVPRLLCHLGRVVLHASAVCLPDGRAVAFFGDTGRGKSTLAANFYQAGLRLLTDDCLQLDAHEGCLTALAAYSSLRLWPGSVEQLFAGAASFEQVTHYSDKRQLIIHGETADEPLAAPLAALFVLGDPSTAPADTIEIRPMHGTAAAMALIEAAFLLDPESRSAVTDNFRRVALLAGGGVPIYRLDYPRRFERLAEVRAAIVREAAS